MTDPGRAGCSLPAPSQHPLEASKEVSVIPPGSALSDLFSWQLWLRVGQPSPGCPAKVKVAVGLEAVSFTSTVRRLSPIHLSPTVKWHLCKLALKFPDKLSPTVAPYMFTKGVAVPFPLLTIQLFRDPQSCEGVLTFAL